MFIKGGKRSWSKIKKACGKNVRNCYHRLLYRTVGLWVKAFRAGRNQTADLPGTGHLSILDHQIEMVKVLHVFTWYESLWLEPVSSVEETPQRHSISWHSICAPSSSAFHRCDWHTTLLMASNGFSTFGKGSKTLLVIILKECNAILCVSVIKLVYELYCYYFI